MATLNFVLPFLPTKPVGGAKNLFQFANRLQARGHDVAIYYSIRRPFKKQKTPVWLRWAITRWRLRQIKWFRLDPNIQQHVVPEVSDRYVRAADATMCTWWQMAFAVEKLSTDKGNRCNFIQDYELWTGQEDLVHRSYSLPIRHIVIAKYLQELVEKFSGIKPPLVNTPIDTSVFRVTHDPALREPATVIMMYSEELRKGSSHGLAALEMVREAVPSLKVTLFSVYDRPEKVPSWMDFVTRPSNLPAMYNQHAVFVSPSLGEGWGLPPAESMASGCAVVCTDIGGHRDYAWDGETALLVDAQEPRKMADRIIQLITDRDLRLRLSANGQRLIAHDFTWDAAVRALEENLLRR